MYSLISTRIILSGSPNKISASDLAKNVLPTPVEPKKINDPIGLFASLIPTRFLLIALEIDEIASCWPITFTDNVSSIFNNLADSLSSNLVIGTPFILEIIS